MAKPVYQNYILLPKAGNRFSTALENSGTQAVFDRLKTHARLDTIFEGDLPDEAVVLDSAGKHGAKLIRLAEADLPELRAQLPGFRIVPEVFYFPQRWQQEVRSKPSALAKQVSTSVRIFLKETKTNKPVAGAVVVAFTDFEQREGEQATSDAQGVVRFKSIGNRLIDQLYVYPKAGYWSYWRKKMTVKNNDTFPIQPIKLGYTDARNFFYPTLPGYDAGG
ncbi:hypothetical protein [Spirosoma areae]